MKINDTTIRKIIDGKIFWVIISLLASVLLWTYVTQAEGDSIDKTFYGIKVEFDGESQLRDTKDFLITNVDNSSISITVNGSRSTISQLSAASIRAKVDVSGISSTGTVSLAYTIKYPNGIDTSGLTVTGASTGIITFAVDKLYTKTINIKGVFEGSVADGYKAGSLEFNPSTISVSGAKNEVDKVAYAWVVMEKDNAEKSVTQDMAFELRDADGNTLVLDNVETDRDTVSVTLPIMVVKEVPLTVNIIEGGGATEENSVITVTPSSIKVSGDAKTLSGINKVVLGTIDLSTVSDGFEQSYSIVIDESLENITGVSEAKVHISMRGLETKILTINNFSCINLTEGYKANILTTSLRVVIRAEKSVIDSISAENVRAVADMSDIGNTTGSFTKAVKIYVDGVTNAGAVGEYNIDVEINGA